MLIQNCTMHKNNTKILFSFFDLCSSINRSYILKYKIKRTQTLTAENIYWNWLMSLSPFVHFKELIATLACGLTHNEHFLAFAAIGILQWLTGFVSVLVRTGTWRKQRKWEIYCINIQRLHHPFIYLNSANLFISFMLSLSFYWIGLLVMQFPKWCIFTCLIKRIAKEKFLHFLI